MINQFHFKLRQDLNSQQSKIQRSTLYYAKKSFLSLNMNILNKRLISLVVWAHVQEAAGQTPKHSIAVMGQSVIILRTKPVGVP